MEICIRYTTLKDFTQRKEGFMKAVKRFIIVKFIVNKERFYLLIKP